MASTPVRTRAGRPYGRRLFSNACRVCIYYQFLSSVSIGQRRLGGRPAGARRREAREGRRAPSASPVRPDRGARGGRRAGARSEGLRAAGLLPRRTSTEVSRQLKPYRQLPSKTDAKPKFVVYSCRALAACTARAITPLRHGTRRPTNRQGERIAGRHVELLITPLRRASSQRPVNPYSTLREPSAVGITYAPGMCDMARKASMSLRSRLGTDGWARSQRMWGRA